MTFWWSRRLSTLIRLVIMSVFLVRQERAGSRKNLEFGGSILVSIRCEYQYYTNYDVQQMI
jgi:hypothetical protein